MSDDDIEVLRVALHAKGRAQLHPRLITTSVIEGRRRRHRRRIAATTVAAVGVAVVVASGVTAEAFRQQDNNPLLSDQSTPSSTESAEKTSPLESPFAWAQSLPRGSDTQVIVVAGGALTTPGGSVRLPGTDAGLIGRTVNGVAVLLEFDNLDRAGTFTSSYALVADDGTVTELPNPTERGMQDATISPDGTLIAYGGIVRDVVTMNVVADIPPGAVTVESWTDAGIIYSTRTGDLFIWSPGGGDPIALEENPGVYPSQTRAGFRNENPCSDVVRLSDDGSVTRTLAQCYEKTLISVSPDGTRALDRDLDVVSVPDGSVETLGEGAPSNVNAFSALVWTSDSEFVFPVAGRAKVLVGCNAISLRCERVSDGIAENGEIQLAR